MILPIFINISRKYYGFSRSAFTPARQYLFNRSLSQGPVHIKQLFTDLRGICIIVKDDFGMEVMVMKIINIDKRFKIVSISNLPILMFLLASIGFAQTANDYLARGTENFQKGQFDLAISDYSKAIDIDPQLAKAYNNRGLAYYNKRQYDSAISDYSKAIKIDPQFAKAYYNRGNTYEDKGQVDTAILDYSKAIEIDPQYAKAYNTRGLAYGSKGQLDSAISDYSRAIEIDPQNALAYNNRGIAYNSKGQTVLAISDCSKAIEIDPQYAFAYVNRGNAYGDKRQYDSAISDYSKAIEIDPQLAGAYYSRGWTYLLKGDWDKAYADSAHSLELNGSKDDWGPYSIIDGYLSLRKRGKTLDADQFVKKWLKMVKPSDWTTQILKYFAGQLTSKQLLVLAVDNGKLTQAHTYIGEIQLLLKDKTNAVRDFNWVKANGARTYFEYALSLAELERSK